MQTARLGTGRPHQCPPGANARLPRCSYDAALIPFRCDNLAGRLNSVNNSLHSCPEAPIHRSARKSHFVRVPTDHPFASFIRSHFRRTERGTGRPSLLRTCSPALHGLTSRTNERGQASIEAIDFYLATDSPIGKQPRGVAGKDTVGLPLRDPRPMRRQPASARRAFGIRRLAENFPIAAPINLSGSCPIKSLRFVLQARHQKMRHGRGARERQSPFD